MGVCYVRPTSDFVDAARVLQRDSVPCSPSVIKASLIEHQLLPMSANFLSSKMTKSCLALRCCNFSITDPSKSSSISICVLGDRSYQDAYTTCTEKSNALMRQTYGPTASMMFKKCADLVTSTLTARLDFFRSIVSNNSRAAGLDWWSARLA